MRQIFLAAALTMLALPAFAATYRLDIEMRADRFIWVIKGVSVSGAKVTDFRRDPSTGDATMKVTVPDGTCQSPVRVYFTNYKVLEARSYNLCSEQGMWVD